MLLEEYKNQNDDMIHMFLVYISKESTLGDLYEYVQVFHVFLCNYE